MKKRKSKQEFALIDPESEMFRRVQYDLYHTNLDLKCPICKKAVAHLSGLGVHMRKTHPHSYLELQIMKRKACSRFYKLCKYIDEKMAVNWLDAEFAVTINNYKKSRRPMGPDRLRWPKYSSSGSTSGWSELSKASNPKIMSNMG